MSTLVNELRQFWLPGIHKVVGYSQKGLVGLLAEIRYQIYTPTTPTEAELTFDDWALVTEAYATDSARMSTAAIETAEGILPNLTLPKSAGWLFVRAYYAGFFAAHSIERMLGRSCVQLDQTAVNAVDSISTAFGMQPSGGLERGLYTCVADAPRKTVTLRKVVGEGSHESLWNDFSKLISEASTQILMQPGGSIAAQQAAGKLTELVGVLRNFGQAPKGNWLSIIRNRINYQHSFGTWFPYSERAAFYDGLFLRLQGWEREPDDITIWPQPGRDLQRYIESCALLVSLCRVLCLDMAERCPSGKSFHHFSALNLLSQLKRPILAVA